MGKRRSHIWIDILIKEFVGVVPSDNEPNLLLQTPQPLNKIPKNKTKQKQTEPCFSWLNPGQIVIHRAAFGPLQPAVVGILSNDTSK